MPKKATTSKKAEKKAEEKTETSKKTTVTKKETKKKTTEKKKTATKTKKADIHEKKAKVKAKEKKLQDIDESYDNDDDIYDDQDAQCTPPVEQMPFPMDNEEKPTLTRRGLELLTSELKDLKSIKRQEVADRIRQARSLGDISENSEYEEAKRDQAMIESRIIELERLLQSAIIVDETAGSENCVRVGTKIKVENLSTKEKELYKIVGTLEADPLKNSISNSSPFGKAMIGRQMGEVVKVPTPQGFVKYRILEIKKGS